MNSLSGGTIKYGFKVKLDHEFPEKRSQILIPRWNQILDLITLFLRYLAVTFIHWCKGRIPVMDYFHTQTGKRIYGVPIGGIGSGTIGRGFKGEFCRYQLKPGMCLYKTLYANQFIVTIKNESGEILYQKPLTNAKPLNNVLKSWDWSFKGENAEYIGLYPRSWTTFYIPEHSITLTCRQISPVIPHNYKTRKRAKSSHLVNGVCVRDRGELLSLLQVAVTVYAGSKNTTGKEEFEAKPETLSQTQPDLDNTVFRKNKSSKKDSSLPAAVFVWDVENNSQETKYVKITFTFQNGIGDKEDRSGGCYSEKFEKSVNHHTVTGVLIHHEVDNMPYTFCVSAKKKDNVHVSCLKSWNPLGDGKELWDYLKTEDNSRTEEKECTKARKGEQIACAVSARTKVTSASVNNLEFSLVWHMPRIHFGEGKMKYWKYYTKFFGKEANAAADIASYSLSKYLDWEREIEKWQNPVLNDEELPPWFKSALFNETYFVSDGGSIWIEIDDNEKLTFQENDPRLEYGRFAYLEGHEYRMYNTYDVHFYASFALAMLWPKLQTVIQKDFCDTISQENRSRRWHLANGVISFRKFKNSVPHDLGDPGEEPFLKINAYPIHDVSEWRDLGVKFVLQCYRDYYLSRDITHLRDMWNNICVIMRNSLRWDEDGDGLIENSNSADQTYDTWVMSGPSSYCGILWLAALQCTCEMAKILSDQAVHSEFKNILTKAKSAVEEKLWNGNYYNFDCSSRRLTIMSDQLCGLWYIKSCGLKNEILPEENVKKALKTIYENNVLKFKNGTSGAVNGMNPDGRIDIFTLQSEETWTGVVYGLSSLMIHQGMIDEGFHTASGIYKTVYEKIGLGYETPEALFEQKSYRSIGYMRPLSIWSMLLAWNMRKESATEGTL